MQGLFVYCSQSTQYLTTSVIGSGSSGLVYICQMVIYKQPLGSLFRLSALCRFCGTCSIRSILGTSTGGTTESELTAGVTGKGLAWHWFYMKVLGQLWHVAWALIDYRFLLLLDSTGLIAFLKEYMQLSPMSEKTLVVLEVLSLFSLCWSACQTIS